MNDEAIRFYCGVSEGQWNHSPVEPGPYVCISPVYGRKDNATESERISFVRIPKTCQVIQDSGAFSDGPKQRTSPAEALERQIAHAERFGYAQQITHRASYDVLIDEKWIGGIRYKARWSEADAELACKITVRATAYLAEHRHGIGAIMSAQGVSARQYLKCAEQIIPYLSPGDMFGLGGWCITGKMPKQFLPVFQETMHLVIPFLAKEGVERVHIWGVCYPKALGELLWLCDQHGLRLSTDGAGPCMHPCFGQWGYGSWRKKAGEYQQPPPVERGRHRKVHVYLTRRWLRDFRARETGHYRSRYQPAPQQLVLMEG